MSFRFITKSIHAYLIDYPVASVLIAAPFALKLGESGPLVGHEPSARGRTRDHYGEGRYCTSTRRMGRLIPRGLG
jgi:hypothetical protein